MEKISVVYPNLKRDSDGKFAECKLLPPEFQNPVGLNSDVKPASFYNLPKVRSQKNSYLTL